MRVTLRLNIDTTRDLWDLKEHNISDNQHIPLVLTNSIKARASHGIYCQQ